MKLPPHAMAKALAAIKDVDYSPYNGRSMRHAFKVIREIVEGVQEIERADGSVRLRNLKPGDFLFPDAGFTCMKENTKKIVFEDIGQRLYVKCKQGQHFLDGQEDYPGGELVGLKSRRWTEADNKYGKKKK